MDSLLAANQKQAAAKAASKLNLLDAFPGLEVVTPDEGMIGRLLAKQKYGIAYLSAAKKPALQVSNKSIKSKLFLLAPFVMCELQMSDHPFSGYTHI